MSDNLTKTVLALGYFDSVHKGHRVVLSEAKKLADELGAKLTVFTFKGNLKAALSGEKDKYVYGYKEREVLFRELGADDVFFAPVDFNFLSLGKLAFLNKMNKKYSIVGYVCGEDYRFGKFGEGKVKDLAAYAESKKQRLIVVPPVLTEDGRKISTTYIKRLLAAGDLKKANEMLGRPYSFTGVVKEGRKVGTEMGFPTANVIPDKEKQPVRDGVYAGHLFIEGTRYKAVINYGTRPTFHLSDKLAEIHIMDFSGDLYGKEITVFMDAFIREIVRFYSEEELARRIKQDEQEVRDGKFGEI